MFSWFKIKYNRIFFVLSLSVIALFSVNAPKEYQASKFIFGDGLGYYSYLPAIFIYHDKNFEFKWFNETYNHNYSYSSFPNPEDNLLVIYGKKKINKYYPGLSFLLSPFFITAHIAANIFHLPTDGFSAPYQWAVAFAALCYLLVGLFFLRKLLQKLFESEWISVVVPFFIFYGTPLLNEGLYSPSLSHVYSFTFIVLFLYYTQSFFNDVGEKWHSLFMCLFCFFIIICIRPLNGLIILTLPAFIPKNFFKQKLDLGKFKIAYVFISLFALFAIIYQFYIQYRQTGALFPYTYGNERFYLSKPKIFFVLFSYHAGLFVYVPLAFVAMFGIFFLKSWKWQLALPLVFFLVIYLYASWWYWPIISRTLVDYYVLLAIFLAALFKKIENFKKWNILLISVILICIAHFQLKSYQIKHHIIDANYTFSELFWKNFLRLKPANLFAIPPSSILKQEVFVENFETNDHQVGKSKERVHSGNYSAVLNDNIEFTSPFSYNIPNFFKQKGLKKIRFSFWSYYTGDINQVHVIMTFHDKEDKQLRYVPFYINNNTIRRDIWDLEQFGMEFSDEELTNMASVKIYLWNPEHRNAMYFDEAKTEFILTDKSYEVIQ